jgi:exonuclease III
MTIRIISLNIQQGGGSRIARLTDWLARKNPSVVVLSEWRNNVGGQQIRDRLTNSGLQTIPASRTTPKINRVLLAATDLTGSQVVTPPGSTVGDLIMISLAQGIQILGCYFPQRLAKAPFFQRCIQLAQTKPDVPLIIVGDFNTGRNDLDIQGTGTRFHCADLFESLSSDTGLIDLWRAQHGDRQEWTWCSRVNGFRIDHVFGNKAFVNRFPTFRCEIDHLPRLSKLTDHSAVILEAD